MDTNSPQNQHLRTKLVPPINETTTSTRDLVPPDYNEDYEAYWAWQNDYEENKEKYIEEEFVQSGPVRLLEAVYCDPCKAKVFNFDELNLQSIGKAIDHLTLNKKNRGEGLFFAQKESRERKELRRRTFTG